MGTRQTILAQLHERHRMALMWIEHGGGDAGTPPTLTPAVQTQIHRVQTQYDIPVIPFTINYVSDLPIAGAVVGEERGQDVLALFVHPSVSEEDQLRVLFHEEAHLLQNPDNFPDYDTIEGYFLRERDAWEQVDSLAQNNGFPDLITPEWWEENQQRLEVEESLLWSLSLILGSSSVRAIHRLETNLLTLRDPFMAPFLRASLGLKDAQRPTAEQLLGLLEGYYPPLEFVNIQRDVALRGGWSQSGFDTPDERYLPSIMASDDEEQNEQERRLALNTLYYALQEVAGCPDTWRWGDKKAMTDRWDWEPRLVQEWDGKQIIVAWYDLARGGSPTPFLRVVQGLVRSHLADTLSMTWRVGNMGRYPLYAVELQWKSGDYPTWHLFCQCNPRHKPYYVRQENALRAYINGFRNWSAVLQDEDMLLHTMTYLWGKTVGPAPDSLLVQVSGIEM